MKLKTMSTRRKVGLLGVAAFVLMGASTPSACTPKPVSLQPVLGASTVGGSSAADPGTTCPLIDPKDGGAKYRGVAAKWGERIAAKDPKEWLSLHLCYEKGGRGGVERVSTGTFTVYTTSGNLKGTVTSGLLATDAVPRRFDFSMKITSGSGAYTGATGTLLSAGCMTSTQQVIAGWLNTTRQPDPAKCKPPALKPLAGAATTGIAWTSSSAPNPCPAAAPTHDRFTQTIAAADPEEYLSIHACYKREDGADTDTFTSGTFAIYTEAGDVKGTLTGKEDAGVGINRSAPVLFDFRLSVTSGTGDYELATGVMSYSGCLTRFGDVYAAQLTDTDVRFDLPDVCLERGF